MKKQTTLIFGLALMSIHLNAASTFTIDAGQPAGKVSPMLYGLMTEEINHGYDGGLYAELIQNRAFLDNDKTPVHWSAVIDGKSIPTKTADPSDPTPSSVIPIVTMSLDPSNPLNDKLTNSLRINIYSAAKGSPEGVWNEGYWGIPVQPNTTYHAAIWVKAAAGGLGPMTVSIVSQDGGTVFAAGKIPQLGTSWNRYEVTLKTGNVAPTDDAKFALTLEQPGTV